MVLLVDPRVLVWPPHGANLSAEKRSNLHSSSYVHSDVARACTVFGSMSLVCQVDKGAIKHVLAGANVFCGGLVSSGAKMEADLQPGQPVILMAEGKVHACAVRNE